MHRVMKKTKEVFYMEAYRDYDEFKSYINSKIKEAESEYRENYKSYILTEQDKRIKDFLDTLYCIKNVPDEDAVKILENSIIEIAFLLLHPRASMMSSRE